MNETSQSENNSVLVRCEMNKRNTLLIQKKKLPTTIDCKHSTKALRKHNPLAPILLRVILRFQRQSLSTGVYLLNKSKRNLFA